MKNLTITHFIPLIGPWYMAADRLKDEGYLISNKYIFSFSAFKKNEQHLIYNYDVEIDYLPDELVESSVSEYKEYIKKHNIQPTDIQLSIPPCAGLSLLNKNSGSGCAANDWIYECVKWFLAQDSNVLCFENAPGLVNKEGLKVISNINDILINEGVEDNYTLHVTKTSTLAHGIPQKRVRCFLYLYKNKERRKIFKNIKHETPIIEDFLTYPEECDYETQHFPLIDKPTEDQLSFIKNKNQIEIIRKKLKDENKYTFSPWKLWLEEYQKDPFYFDGFDYIKKKCDYKIKKLNDGKGFWDAGCNFIRNRANGVIARNLNVMHPIYDRLITIREYMALMGYPDDFYLIEPKKNINHMCQSLPICTGVDHLKWAIGLWNNDEKYVKKIPKISNNILLLQNNVNQDLENELFQVENFSHPWKKFKNKTNLNEFLKI